jgi:integrase
MPPKRRHKINRRLPERWRWHHGAIYYRVPPGQEHQWEGKTSFRLGKNEAEAFRTWHVRLSDNLPDTLATMHQVIDRYMVEVLPKKSPKAQESNRIAINRIRPIFGHMPPAAIKLTHGYRYFDLVKQKHGHTSAKRDIECLRHMLTKAAQWGVIEQNPLLGQMRLENPAPRDHLPKDWEIRLALKHAPPLLSCYIRFKLMTGLRRGDILRLSLSDIESDGIHTKPHKTAKTSSKKLIIEWDPDGELRALVDEILALPPTPRIQSAPLFVTRNGQPFIKPDGRANGFDTLWQRFMNKLVAETDVTRFQERDLRALVASESDTLEEAKERLGHSDSRITARVYRRKPTKVKPLIR